MKRSARSLLLCCLLIGWTAIGVAAEPADRTVNGFQSTELNALEFHAPSIELETVIHQGIEYQKIVTSVTGTASEEGEPNLPVFTTFYAVDPRKTYDVVFEVLESEVHTGVTVLPVQDWDNPEVREDQTLIKNESIYSSNAAFPSSPVTMSAPMVMRDLEVVEVSFTPYQYHPATHELTVITAANVGIVETGTREATNFIPALASRDFEPLYQALVANYDQVMTLNENYQKPTILYILPSNSSAIEDELAPLLAWRKRAGYMVHVATSAETGTSSASIKNYIQTAYTSWENPPVWVALVGDAGGSYSIPTFTDTWSGYNGEGDNPYALLTGDDGLPEVFIGRLSFSSPTELATIVNKTVQYESNPYMGENWFTRACLVGDPNSSGISTVITNQFVDILMSYNGYDDIRTVYTSPFPSQMVSNLSDGMTFFNYRGYYGVSGFTCSDVNSANNGFKLPIATVITCGTGSFASGTSISECFLRAGTPAQPKGAVGSIGTATLGTHTMFNNAVDMGFYYGVFGDKITTPSAALARGKLHLYLTYPTNPNNYVNIFSHWNSLMGDPAVRMWTKVPDYIQVAFQPTVAIGTNFVDIQVNLSSTGLPLADAYVTVYKEGVIAESGFTNHEGEITLPLPVGTAGEVLVTVVKNNHIPYQGSLQIINPAVSINLVADQVVVVDDGSGESVGNGDGNLNPGETVELTIPVKNFGAEASTSITAVLHSSLAAVNIFTDSLVIGPINAGATVVPAGHFVVAFQNGIEDGTILDLRVDFIDSAGTVWHGYYGGTTEGTSVRPVSVSIIDFGDNVLNPGETAEVEILLNNSGSVSAGNVTATIACPNPDIEIIDNFGSWGTIFGGQVSSNSEDQFTIYAGENIIPGTITNLSISVVGDDGIQFFDTIELQIGVQGVSDPMGPDDYGYYIYDSGDLLYGAAPYYNWFEIDDRYGGDGTYLSSLQDGGNNQDHSVYVTLPFTFRMYGQEYNQITICSNGWIGMGQQDIASFRNYQIPGPGGPSPMIAGFWDDLSLTSNGRVYTKNDVAGNQFIVQWSRVRTFDKNDEETFQIILRDPLHYFTPTGDGEVLVQYNTFNNTSSGNYSGWPQTHGGWATIGIEDPSATIGLQYTFSNVYAPAAMPLTNESAILITTRGSTIRMRGDVTQDNVLNIYDILTLVDFILADDITYLNPYLADINGDGMVNILDVIGMVQTIMAF